MTAAVPSFHLSERGRELGAVLRHRRLTRRLVARIEVVPLTLSAFNDPSDRARRRCQHRRCARRWGRHKRSLLTGACAL